MKRLSIIIPVYNAEKTIKKCLNSILEQEYRNIEVLIIDDGSIDNSLYISREYEKRDKRIKVITKINSGVSSTRNLGIKISTGDYIIFIDADDYLEKNTFIECMNIIETTGTDILKFNFLRECGKYKKKNAFTTESEILIEKKQFNEKNIYNQLLSSSDFYNIWNNIIKKDILKNIYFNEQLDYAEDYLFMMQCVFYANSIYITNRYYYHYCINDNSVTQNYNRKMILRKIECILYVNNIIRSILADNKISIDLKLMKDNIKNLIRADIINITYYFKYREYLSIINDLCKMDGFNNLINNSSEFEERIFYYKHKTIKTIRVLLKKIFSMLNK
ncbi:glycosyltransferase family 2 protein [Clostridium butyricum]|uniref:glycosyltransferase family 2 protein n=2 Tax=Clostridium butyricum TaxID=1492 RepID=UPI0005EB1630|nr:glycosyltransferase family 2 protein [Clostridium butyricum]MZI81732.1 glycosyltransferase [Clostridium butyricum]